MNYRHFNKNRHVALSAVVFTWLGSLIYGWLLVISGTNGEIIIPSVLTISSALSVVWWRSSKSADQQLLEQVLSVTTEWKQGVVSSRITNLDKSRPELQQLCWNLNDVMDQVETAQMDLRYSMAKITLGKFTRKSYPEGLHGGFKRALIELNVVTETLSTITHAISVLMRSMADGDFSKRMDIKVEGEYKLTLNHATQVMQTMQSMLGDIGKVMGGVAQGDISQRVQVDGNGDLGQLKDDINLSLDALDSLNDILLVASALSKGDLTQTITKDYPGTFGAVISGLNGTVENLRSLVGGIKTATDNISDASQEIALGNNDLSHRTEKQTASLKQTASRVEELNSTVQQNTKNAEHANQLAVGASGIAGKGAAVFSKVVDMMDGINESSHKVVDIISVIDSIAFQTNILALNAAVEAARAGEQGRGFAVVATEVRNLAQRAASAAGEIKNLIGDSVEKVEAGSELVVQAGKTMEEIVSSVRSVSFIISEISKASVVQTSGIEQVNESIHQMDSVTKQNADLVEQAAAAAESLERQTKHLLDAVGNFKLRNG